MTAIVSATTIPEDLPGVDPAWSRVVRAVDADGVERSWHVLDNGAEPTIGTLLCVHGNPTWSYLWRRLLDEAPAGWRVLAADHLDMGYSERTGTVRRLDRRIDDLSRLTDALGVTGTVVAVAHDWGGPISLGWALRHQDQVRGVVLMNTAVAQPESIPMPPVIRLARTDALIRRVCVDTPIFVRAAALLSRPAPSREVRDAYLAPYGHADRRHGVRGFVEDIPIEDDHPSQATLAAIAEGLTAFGETPALLLWGPSDPVFSDGFLDDLHRRLPHADLHRFPGASHLVVEDADTTGAVIDWIGGVAGRKSAGLIAPSTDVPSATRGASNTRSPLWSELDRRRDDPEDAVIELGADGERRISFAALAADVDALAAGLVRHGVEPGHRVALLVPPGVDLATIVYACWRMGAVVVLIDGGLGPRSMDRAVRGARADHLIAIPKGIAAARALRWPGSRIVVGTMSSAASQALGTDASLDEVIAAGRNQPLPPEPAPDADAAVVFTSGATGPSKGVVYTHGQIRAQRDAVAHTYTITTDDRLVAAFAPFALYGPALGIASIVPDMDVSAPATLTAGALVGAIEAIDATLVFASPAAISGVLADAGTPGAPSVPADGRVRLLLSAGAPVRAEVLRDGAAWLGAGDAHTPYGMSEVLPVADISLAEIDRVGPGNGVCVGQPVRGVDVAIRALDDAGEATGGRTATAGVTGEICVLADHVRDRYDRLWRTQRASVDPDGWHRTGDVGHLDDDGRLWIEGRLSHVITTAHGPVTPVWVEVAAEELPGVRAAAAVGIGPARTQQLVVAVELTVDAAEGEGQASLELADEVRAAVSRARPDPPAVAAVLVIDTLPVDQRHNSKIDRARVSRWADQVLAGSSVRSQSRSQRLGRRLARLTGAGTASSRPSAGRR